MSLKKTRNALLRRPVLRTRDQDRAMKSMFQWGIVPTGDEYYLSALGMINGPLPKYFKKVLVVDTETDDLTIVAKWW